MSFVPNAKGYLFTLNKRGAKEILKRPSDEVGAVAKKVTEAALANENADDLVWLNHYTTDRAASSVTVPAGKQAKHGILTKAASAAGLEVHPPK